MSSYDVNLTVKHTLLPHCWVCGKRFLDSTPPGIAVKEIHHIVPQQAGGTDGPTVTLCNEHHDKAHRIALRLGAKKPKPYFDLLTGEPDMCRSRLLWLATVISNAFAAVANDPNKKINVVLVLTRKEQLIIDRLKKVYPSHKSRADIFMLALENLYRKTFAN